MIVFLRLKVNVGVNENLVLQSGDLQKWTKIVHYKRQSDGDSSYDILKKEANETKRSVEA